MKNDTGEANLTETARETLRACVAKIEAAEEDKAAAAERVKEHYSVARTFGFDMKALRKLIAMRKIDRAEREEQESILDVYLLALGEI